VRSIPGACKAISATIRPGCILSYVRLYLS
jgi:hypothetical protein